MNKMEELRNKIAELQSELFKEQTNLFESKSKELFNQYPRLKSAMIKSYIPYFNDGDACEYILCVDEPEINGYHCWEESNEKEFENLWFAAENKDKEAKKIVEAVENFFGQFDESFYRGKFGDHMKLIITPNGYEREEYDNHD